MGRKGEERRRWRGMVDGGRELDGIEGVVSMNAVYRGKVILNNMVGATRFMSGGVSGTYAYVSWHDLPFGQILRPR